MLHFCALAQSQDNMEGSLGLPGDNLNLYAVMNLFQESKTLELFERNLNDENSRINNLDLNGDGKIDYLSVVDNFDGKAHTIVLKDAINANESQDIAVFYIGKDVHNKVQVQLIGDEALYGKDYIIEPNMGGNVNTGQTANPGFAGNSEVVVVEQPVVRETSAWPLVSLLFLPSYVAWHSPYYYGYYPNYWRPWQPLFWHSYYGYHSNMNHYYEGNFRHTAQYRDTHFREHYYAGRRSFAPTVIKHRNEGFYKKNYSHPELRKEGTARYNKMHPANLNRQNNRPEVLKRNATPANRQIGNRPVNNQLNNRPANRPGVNNSRSAVNQNKSIPASRQGANQQRPSVNQGNNRTPAARPNPLGNQNNAKTFTRPAANPQQNRQAASPQQNRQAASPQQNRQAASPQQNRQAASPQQNRQVASPQQNRQAASPQQNRQAASPQQNRQAASPQQNRQAASPQQNRPAASPQQNRQAASPQQNRQAASPQQSRPAASPQQSRPANNQGQSRQAATPAPSRQPAPKAAPAAKPSKAPQKKENAK